MEKRLREYIKYIEKKIEEPMTKEERERIIKNLLVQISFFQHERLIHLIVTVSFAILTLITVISTLLVSKTIIIVIAFLLIVLLVPYIMHYYKLENGVQRLYKSFDRLVEKIEN